MAEVSKTLKSPRALSVITGIRPLGLSLMNQGSFWTLVEMSILVELQTVPVSN